MVYVANAQAFKVELSKVIRHASQNRPSRVALASELEGLAMKLGAKARSPRKKKTPSPPASGRQELINVGRSEANALEHLKLNLDDAVYKVKREIELIGDSLERLKQDAEDDGHSITKDDFDNRWDNHRFFAGEVLDPIVKGLDYLADTLERHLTITRENDLAAAVRAFQKRVPDDGDWPEGKGEKHFHDVKQAIEKAVAKVPTQLGKTSEFTKLRETFEAIVEAVKLMTGKTIQVPKIPKALDPDDPRQLGFGFTASARISNPDELKERLNAIWRTASQPNPSREELGGALLDLVDGLKA